MDPITQELKTVKTVGREKYLMPDKPKLSMEQLQEIMQTARSGDASAKRDLTWFFLKEVEIRSLRKTGQTKDLLLVESSEPSMATEAAFGFALDEWLLSQKKFDLKTFPDQLAALLPIHARRLEKMIGDAQTGKNFETLENALFSQFGYLKRKNESPDEYRQLFRIALLRNLNWWVWHTPKKRFAKELRLWMNAYKDRVPKQEWSTIRLDAPYGSPARRGARFGELAFPNEHSIKSRQILLPASSNRIENARRTDFSRTIWNQLGPPDVREQAFAAWQKGHTPYRVTIWHENGFTSEFEHPSLESLTKVYEKWVDVPGAITIRWRKKRAF